MVSISGKFYALQAQIFFAFSDPQIHHTLKKKDYSVPLRRSLLDECHVLIERFHRTLASRDAVQVATMMREVIKRWRKREAVLDEIIIDISLTSKLGPEFVVATIEKRLLELDDYERSYGEYDTRADSGELQKDA